RTLPISSLFPYTTLFRSVIGVVALRARELVVRAVEREAGGGEVIEAGEMLPAVLVVVALASRVEPAAVAIEVVRAARGGRADKQDRKSTRLNSSHVAISY